MCLKMGHSKSIRIILRPSHPTPQNPPSRIVCSEHSVALQQIKERKAEHLWYLHNFVCKKRSSWVTESPKFGCMKRACLVSESRSFGSWIGASRLLKRVVLVSESGQIWLQKRANLVSESEINPWGYSMVLYGTQRRGSCCVLFELLKPPFAAAPETSSVDLVKTLPSKGLVSKFCTQYYTIISQNGLLPRCSFP